MSGRSSIFLTQNPGAAVFNKFIRPTNAFDGCVNHLIVEKLNNGEPEATLEDVDFKGADDGTLLLPGICFLFAFDGRALKPPLDRNGGGRKAVLCAPKYLRHNYFPHLRIFLLPDQCSPVDVRLFQSPFPKNEFPAVALLWNGIGIHPKNFPGESWVC